MRQKLHTVVLTETNFQALKNLGNDLGLGVQNSLNDVVTVVLKQITPMELTH